MRPRYRTSLYAWAPTRWAWALLILVMAPSRGRRPKPPPVISSSDRSALHRLDVADHRPNVKSLGGIFRASVDFIAVDQLEHHCAHLQALEGSRRQRRYLIGED